MAVVRAASLDEAIEIINLAISGREFIDIEGIDIGSWASTYIRLPKDYHSEISSPFLTAYSEIQNELYRIVALVKTGSSDIR